MFRLPIWEESKNCIFIWRLKISTWNWVWYDFSANNSLSSNICLAEMIFYPTNVQSHGYFWDHYDIYEWWKSKIICRLFRLLLNLFLNFLLYNLANWKIKTFGLSIDFFYWTAIFRCRFAETGHFHIWLQYSAKLCLFAITHSNNYIQ